MLVRESISFQRYKDPKTALFGLRPGQIVKEAWPNEEYGEGTKVKTIGYYLILESGKEPGKYISTELGYKMFDKLNIWGEYERYGLKFDLVPASNEEIKDIKQAYKKEPEKFKSLKKYLTIWGLMDKKTELLQQLTESIGFQRYRDPKRALFGLIPGQLVKHTTANIRNIEQEGPLTIVGIFLEGDRNFIRVGHFSTYNVSGIPGTLIMPGTSVPVWFDEKDLEPLTPEETIIVKKSLNSPRGKIILKNIEERFNVKPLLESNFERYKDPKTALFGLRPGQLVKYNPDEDSLVNYLAVYHKDSFSELSPEYASVINIGKLSGNQVDLDLNPNGPYGTLANLKPLNTQEKVTVMQILLYTPNGKRMIKELENKWPVKLTESSFERYKDPKHALFGFRVGQLVVGKKSVGAIGYDVDCIIQIINENDCVTASFGRFEKLHRYNTDKEDLRFNRITGQGDWYETFKDLRILDKEETEFMQKYLKDPANKSYIKLKEDQYVIAIKGYYSELIPENERIRISV